MLRSIGVSIESHWEGLFSLQVADSMRGVIVFCISPMMLYVNRPMAMVLYLRRPDGVSATIG